jgi:hypothetical protein
MLKGSARSFIETRFVADTASNAERANPAWPRSEGVSTAARLQLMSELGHSLHAVWRLTLGYVRFDLKTDLTPPDPVAHASRPL